MLKPYCDQSKLQQSRPLTAFINSEVEIELKMSVFRDHTTSKRCALNVLDTARPPIVKAGNHYIQDEEA